MMKLMRRPIAGPSRRYMMRRPLASSLSLVILALLTAAGEAYQFQDPHTTLGVPRGASTATIKAAFRRAALIYHPDRNLGDNAAARHARHKFQEASEAYEMLVGNLAQNRFAASPGPEPAPTGPPPRTRWRRHGRNVRVTVERGWVPGSTQSFVIDGQTVIFVVPTGVEPGQKLVVEMPAPPPPSASSWQPPRQQLVLRQRLEATWQRVTDLSSRVAGSCRRAAGLLRRQRGFEVEPLWSYTLASGGQCLMVKVPKGFWPGQSFIVIAADGRRQRVTVPPGMGPGSSIQVTFAEPRSMASWLSSLVGDLELVGTQLLGGAANCLGGAAANRLSLGRGTRTPPSPQPTLYNDRGGQIAGWKEHTSRLRKRGW